MAIFRDTLNQTKNNAMSEDLLFEATVGYTVLILRSFTTTASSFLCLKYYNLSLIRFS